MCSSPFTTVYTQQSTMQAQTPSAPPHFLTGTRNQQVSDSRSVRVDEPTHRLMLRAKFCHRAPSSQRVLAMKD